MNIEKLTNDIVAWMTNYIDQAHQSSWVVGVSGGVDSSVVVRLCEATEFPTIAVAMPMYLYGDSAEDSLKKAMSLCVGRDVDFRIREIGPIVEAYKKAAVGCSQLMEGNLRSRIRANILYDTAGQSQGLVAGTGNLDEDAIGYFTKGGDGLVDLCPLSALHKSVVRDIARFLDVPNDIIDAPPTAGLWDGQTDEDELGMTYDEVAWAIDWDDAKMSDDKTVSARQTKVLEGVRFMRERADHKLIYPPIFTPDG
jgi:NAD+ synthase